MVATTTSWGTKLPPQAEATSGGYVQAGENANCGWLASDGRVSSADFFSLFGKCRVKGLT